jgi:hypothetical protein
VVDGPECNARPEHQPRRSHCQQEAPLRAQRSPVRQQEGTLVQEDQHRARNQVLLAAHAQCHGGNGKQLPPARMCRTMCTQRGIQREEQEPGREQGRPLRRVGNRVGAERVHDPDKGEDQREARGTHGVGARSEVRRPERAPGQQEEQHPVEEVHDEVAEVRADGAEAEEREAGRQAETGDRAVRERLVRW